MRVDGEPWKQPLPKDDDTIVIEISHQGQVTMLANEPCKSMSLSDPLSSHGHNDHSDEHKNDVDDEEWEDGRRKFGAAETFKLPDEIDIAHLS